MPYKISGTKNATARIIIFKESDWSIESNTIVSGTGAYEIGGVVSGTKTIIAETTAGELLGYGDVDSIKYGGQRGLFGGGGTPTNNFYDIIDYITIDSTSNATDFGDLFQARRALSATSNGENDRGVWAGGCVSANPEVSNDTIDYVTILIINNASNFGDLTNSRRDLAAVSNGSDDRGVFGAGTTNTWSNYLDYITISSTGDATDFGDLTRLVERNASVSNKTNNRGVFAGGSNTSGKMNVIDYITINSTGNATDFGDLLVANNGLSGCSNHTNNRGCFGGGETAGGSSNTIQYITINSTGNATDFGDLTIWRTMRGSTSNGIDNRGVWGGGTSNADEIDYITISSTGDATDFGDLTVSRWGSAATSNS